MSESCEVLVKLIAGPYARMSVSVGQRGRMCISNKFLSDDTTGLGPIC